MCHFLLVYYLGIVFLGRVEGQNITRPLSSQPIFIMALQTGSDDWQELLTKIGIPADSARTYAKTFVEESITKDNLTMIDREVLKELGVTTMGHTLAILKLAKEQPLTSDSLTKDPAVKLPQLHSGMTSQQFQKFRIVWEVFMQMKNMSPAQNNIQLYNCADEAVQTSIINTYPKFFSEEPNRLMDMLEALVTQKSNPMAHRLSFASISRGPGESVQQFIIRLRGTAQDCDFTCPICNHDLSNIYIKHQLVKGTANDALQVDLLAKARSLKTLEENINHAEAFEAALRDQAQMSGTLEMSALCASTYRKEKKIPST